MNRWLVYTDKEDKEHIVNLKDVDDIFVSQAEDEDKEEDPFYVYGNIGSTYIHLYVGTQVECMRCFEKLKEILKPIEINVWEQ